MVDLIKFIIYLYISITINVLSHETGHYLVARILKLIVIKVEIGPQLMAINLGKFRISPLAYKGRIIIEASFQSWAFATAFYLSGAIGNLFIIFVSLHILFGPFKVLLQVIAIAQIVCSLIPIYGSDMSELIKVIKS